MPAAELLEMFTTGRGEEARRRLRDLFGENPPRPDAPMEDQISYRLHLLSAATRQSPRLRSPPPDEASPLLRTLDHILSATDALARGRTKEVVVHARAAAADAPTNAPWIGLRLCAVFQAAVRFTADPAIRIEAIELCQEHADRMDLPHVAVPARTLLGSIRLLDGDYYAAFDHIEAALAVASSSGISEHPTSALAHQFRGYVLLEWNRVDEAEASLRRAWDAAGESGRGVRSGVARVLAHLSSVRGDHEAADEWLDRLETIVAEPMTMRNREWLAAVRARQSWGDGDLRAIDAWLRSYDYAPAEIAEMHPERILARLQELEHVLVMLEATKQWESVVLVAGAVHRASSGKRRWFDVRALSAEAVALHGLARTEEAVHRLDEALELGANGGFVRAYIDGGPERVRLLSRVGRRPGTRSEHAARVLAAAAADAPQATLTDRQLDVVRLLATGLSNKAIAKELGVSITTVKTHLRAAYTSLEVSTRTAAVAQARSKGLL